MTSLEGTSHGPVRVTMVVKDLRGFTHYYEELETTPDAVRDAFDLMARVSSPLTLGAPAGPGDAMLVRSPSRGVRRGLTWLTSRMGV